MPAPVGGSAHTILIYLPQLKVGGAEISMLRLAQGLRDRGQQVCIVVHTLDPVAQTLAGDIEIVGLDAGRTLAALRRLIALLRQRRPDALISALTHTNIVAALATRVARVATRLIVTEHAPISSMQSIDPSWSYRITRALMPAAYRLAHAIVAVSQGVYDDLAPMLGRRTRKKLSVIFNPVLRHDWQMRAQAPVDDPWFQVGAAPVILSVGRLGREKNFGLLIRAFARLRVRATSARLAIIGEGAERTALQALIIELGLEGRVQLLGQRDNPYAYMRRANVFVLPSLFEGFGNVLVEAMACGTAVISTDCPVGPREILCDGEFGTLVPSDDRTALTQAIDDVLDRAAPSARARTRALRARARALEFTVERSVDDYLALFVHANAAPMERSGK